MHHDRKKQVAAGVPPLVSAGAGAVAGLVTNVALQPFDTVKTRLAGGLHVEEFMSVSKTARPYRGMFATFHRVFQEEGIRGLYKGSSATALRVSIGAGCFFAILNGISPPEKRDKQSSVSLMASGAFARSMVGIMMCPVAVVKTRLEADYTGKSYNGLRDCAVRIVREEGVSGLYRGLVPTLVKDVPYASLYFLMYTKLKQALRHWNNEDESVLVQFGAGFTAGAGSTIATQPFEVAQTRLQLKRDKGIGQFRATVRQLRRIAQNEPWTAFFAGGMVKTIKRSISNAAIWVLFEQITLAYSEAHHQED